LCKHRLAIYYNNMDYGRLKAFVLTNKTFVSIGFVVGLLAFIDTLSN